MQPRPVLPRPGARPTPPSLAPRPPATPFRAALTAPQALQPPPSPPARARPVEPPRHREAPPDEPDEAPGAAPDPLERALWQLRPPPELAREPPASPALPLGELVERLLRRVALGGTRTRGTARLELASSALHAVTIHADAGALRVELAGPDRPETRALKDAIEQRLRARGLDAQVELIDDRGRAPTG